jgi:hypothetical protein
MSTGQSEGWERFARDQKKTFDLSRIYDPYP